MASDPKISDTLLFGYSKHYGDRLCREQRTFSSSVWNDEWGVFGDQLGWFGEGIPKHVAVQFRRRPDRQRYFGEPRLEVPARAKELKDA